MTKREFFTQLIAHVIFAAVFIVVVWGVARLLPASPVKAICEQEK